MCHTIIQRRSTYYTRLSSWVSIHILSRVSTFSRGIIDIVYTNRYYIFWDVPMHVSGEDTRTRKIQTSDVAMRSRDLPEISPFHPTTVYSLIVSCCVLEYVWTQLVGLNICTPPAQICKIFSPFTPFGKPRGTQRSCNCSWRRQFEPRYSICYTTLSFKL